MNLIFNKDFRQNFTLVIILCVGMIPLWFNGYCSYVLILLFPVLFNLRLYRITSIEVIVFSVFYTFSLILSGAILSPSSIVFYAIFPIISYQTGIYVSKKFRNEENIILLLCLMAICMAMPAIMDNVRDTIESGEIINVKRMLVVDGQDTSRSATGYGMMLSLICGCIGVILIKTNNKYEYTLKCILIAVSILALFSTIHLVNRTAIVLAFISLVVAILIPPIKPRHIIYATIVLVFFMIVYWLNLNNSDLKIILDNYIERDEGASSVESIGGRDVLWIQGISQIFTEPFGNHKGLLLNSHDSYAHNLIIDGGVKGGVLCFILLIIIFIRYCHSLFRIYKNSFISKFHKYILITLGVTLFLQCMVEPVIEGLPHYFYYLLFFIGSITQFSYRQNSIQS